MNKHGWTYRRIWQKHWQWQYHLATTLSDASDLGGGGSILQMQDEQMRFLGHWAWKWSGARSSYAAFEKELLAGVLLLAAQKQHWQRQVQWSGLPMLLGLWTFARPIRQGTRSDDCDGGTSCGDLNWRYATCLASNMSGPITCPAGNLITGLDL